MACPFDDDELVDVKAKIIRGFLRDRVPRPRFDVFAHTDEYLKERYRFSKDALMYLAKLLKPFISNVSHRRSALSTENVLCIALHFFASGHFFERVADAEHVGKGTVCRAVRTVSLALKRFLHSFVRFPGHKPLPLIKEEFHRVAGFPNVIGCIDGIHVPIKAPSVNKPDYVNGKFVHSINVQIISDATQIITNVEAKWPGSVHESRIFRESSLSQTIHEGHYSGYLLGDRGYPCLSSLITPFPDPEPGPQTLFNQAHSRTRAKVKMTIGILKARFQCLRKLRVSPERAYDITVACVVLHNIATMRGESQPPPVNLDDDGRDEPAPVQDQRDGQLLREQICQSAFH